MRESSGSSLIFPNCTIRVWSQRLSTPPRLYFSINYIVVVVVVVVVIVDALGKWEFLEMEILSLEFLRNSLQIRKWIHHKKKLKHYTQKLKHYIVQNWVQWSKTLQKRRSNACARFFLFVRIPFIWLNFLFKILKGLSYPNNYSAVWPYWQLMLLRKCYSLRVAAWRSSAGYFGRQPLYLYLKPANITFQWRSLSENNGLRKSNKDT